MRLEDIEFAAEIFLQTYPSDRNEAIGFRCKNSHCKQPHMARPRYSYHDGNVEYYSCNECQALLHGPHENIFMCRECGHDERACICFETKEFIYGGPLVMCEQCRKVVVWIDGGVGQGFAGGYVSWDRYSCGHSDMDESGDIAAAM